VKGLEKLTSVRLAEILTQRGNLPTEAITDALYYQDKHGDAFAQVLVGGGHITEWDLAKTVTEHFQLPFLMPSNYQISDQARDKLPEQILFENLLVPIDVFDDVVCVVMPILTPYECLTRIEKDLKCDVFPYVGLISENKKVLAAMYPRFKDWQASEQRRRDAEANKKAAAASSKKGDWMSIFDAGEQAIQQTLTRKK
jgi:hypothetical protein